MGWVFPPRALNRCFDFAPRGLQSTARRVETHLPLLPLASRTEFDFRSLARRFRSHRGVPDSTSCSPFLEVCCPTTLEEADSDLHRVCLTRLCCAFRFSQPLDALFRPRPFRPCFMPVTSLGFDLQRFPPGGSPTNLAIHRSLPAVTRRRCGDAVWRRSFDFEVFSIRRIRTR
jgi:hypothetical protein